MPFLLSGKELADQILDELGGEIVNLHQKEIFPKLTVIMVGEDPASQVYVRKKEEACQKIGILSERILLPNTVQEEELIALIEQLNRDEHTHGLIVQLPLPAHLNASKIIKHISPYKDVDGFHAYNLGKMLLSKDFEDLAPCTPKGITLLLDYYNIDVSGMHVVVVGRSNVVGKPIAMMLLNRNATVTLCHSQTRDLAFHTNQADLLIAALGKPEFIGKDHVKEGAVIVDVGIHRKKGGSLVGDVNFTEVESKVQAITPVPGGVGPMTVACLLRNTVTACQKASKL